MKKVSAQYSKGLFQVTFAVVVALLLSVSLVQGVTTLSTNIATDGTLSVTGLSTFLGGATTTTLTLLNGEVISNATDGVIQMNGIASSTSITLLNGETITNAVDGTVALTGAFSVSGATSLSSTLAVTGVTTLSATSTNATTTITALSVGSTTPVQYGIANAVIDSAGGTGTTTLKIAAPGALVGPCIEMETTGGTVVRLYATTTGAIAYWEAGACK